MRAWLLHSFGAEPALGEAPDPTPRVGEILLNVNACAIGTGERLIAAGGRQSYTGEAFVFPHILGYQACGRVAADHGPWKSGQRLLVNGIFTCGTCIYCQSARQNLCGQMRYMGIDSGFPGAFAEKIAVPAANVFPLPDTLDDLTATIVSEFATAVHVVRKLNLPAAGRAVLIGFGRHGSAIGAILRAQYPGLSISAIDPNSGYAPAAEELGIKLLRDGANCAGDAVGVVDTVGQANTVLHGLELLGRSGTLVLLGAQPRIDLSFEPYRLLMRKEATMTGSVAKSPIDFVDAIAILASGRVPRSLLEVAAFAWKDLPAAWRMDPNKRLALVWNQ